MTLTQGTCCSGNTGSCLPRPGTTAGRVQGQWLCLSTPALEPAGWLLGIAVGRVGKLWTSGLRMDLCLAAVGRAFYGSTRSTAKGWGRRKPEEALNHEPDALQDHRKYLLLFPCWSLFWSLDIDDFQCRCETSQLKLKGAAGRFT